MRYAAAQTKLNRDLLLCMTRRCGLGCRTVTGGRWAARRLRIRFGSRHAASVLTDGESDCPGSEYPSGEQVQPSVT